MERAIEELRAAVERGQAEAVSQVTQAVERVLEERLLGHTDESFSETRGSAVHGMVVHTTTSGVASAPYTPPSPRAGHPPPVAPIRGLSRSKTLTGASLMALQAHAPSQAPSDAQPPHGLFGLGKLFSGASSARATAASPTRACTRRVDESGSAPLSA